MEVSLITGDCSNVGITYTIEILRPCPQFFKDSLANAQKAFSSLETVLKETLWAMP
jgi:hypothetical protein